uniref:Uncharacterized protein n=1 Tax=Avena sativa TaxID=4498 RepID=A0ACD5Z2T0_AVESA
MRTEAIFLRACAKLRSAVGDEAEARLNFAGDLRKMLGAMVVVQPGLQEAEMRIWTGDTSSLLMNWLKDAAQAAYRVMDMVDELQDTRPPAAATMTRMVPRLSIKKNDMATKVNEVKNQVMWLKEYWRTYICGEEGTIPQRPQVMDERTTVSCFQGASVIGRGSDKERIVAVLLSATSNITQGSPSCIILPIFGLAGSGKTTLAKMVFNDTNSFLQEYNFRVWVHVSPKLDINRICEYIISQVVSGGGGQEEINDHGPNLEKYLMCLHGLLNGKKVILVLDDLWEQDTIKLQILKFMLTSLGDKVDVIVTTCNQAIARKICTIEPYRLTPLGDEACWEIIKKSIRFEEDNEELEKIGQEIASKCCGVPSVAGAYARMLHSQDPTRWEEVTEINIWRCCSSIDSTSHSLLSTFGLSYMSMPELRLCFDYYCAIFPNGHNIAKDDLIRQWAILDLIEPSEILTVTQTAEVYITRLLDMSFLRTAKSDPANGKDDKGAILFTMHGLHYGRVYF